MIEKKEILVITQSKRRDARVWAGLLLLAAGLSLADRAFAIWRDDVRNFARADGSYPATAEVTALGVHHSALETRLENHTIGKTMAGTGLAFMLSSLLLLRDL